MSCADRCGSAVSWDATTLRYDIIPQADGPPEKLGNPRSMISFAARVRVAHADEPLDISGLGSYGSMGPSQEQIDGGGGKLEAVGPPWMEVPKLHQFEG